MREEWSLGIMPVQARYCAEEAGFDIRIWHREGHEVHMFLSADQLTEGKEAIVSGLIQSGAPAPQSLIVATVVLSDPDLSDEDGRCDRCDGFRCGPGTYSAMCGVCARARFEESSLEGAKEVRVINVEAVVEDVMES